MPYAYLLWLVVFVCLPLLVLWVWRYTTLLRYRRVVIFTLIGSLIFAVPWDAVAIKQRIWYFTKPEVVGWWFLGLPLEEWLFISLVTLSFTTITIILWEKVGRRA